MGWAHSSLLGCEIPTRRCSGCLAHCRELILIGTPSLQLYYSHPLRRPLKLHLASFHLEHLVGVQPVAGGGGGDVEGDRGGFVLAIVGGGDPLLRLVLAGGVE